MQAASGAEVKATTLPLSEILDRPAGDLRAPDPDAVYRLAASIAALGLLQPIAVDSAGRLLAGGHRLEALRLLAATPSKREEVAAGIEARAGRVGDGELWANVEDAPRWTGEVPVYRVEIDAVGEPERALAIETAENAVRRDLSSREILAAFERLEAQGYSMGSRGRPKKGERRAVPLLVSVFGASERTIRRKLAAARNPAGAGFDEPAPIDPAKALRSARRAAETLAEALKGSRAADKVAARDAARALADAATRALGDRESDSE